ncbi:hypothetical protein, partial [Salipaludibacillus neizhouensis]|uniref:hypothetical protein n=1 Tax=Salipaludibacillus neizhouensis TaxID=885475 RepID=UPI001C7D6CE9
SFINVYGRKLSIQRIFITTITRDGKWHAFLIAIPYIFYLPNTNFIIFNLIKCAKRRGAYAGILPPLKIFITDSLLQ